VEVVAGAQPAIALSAAVLIKTTPRLISHCFGVTVPRSQQHSNALHVPGMVRTSSQATSRMLGCAGGGRVGWRHAPHAAGGITQPGARQQGRPYSVCHVLLGGSVLPGDVGPCTLIMASWNARHGI
jgi:hypothetical protein